MSFINCRSLFKAFFFIVSCLSELQKENRHLLGIHSWNLRLQFRVLFMLDFDPKYLGNFLVRCILSHTVASQWSYLNTFLDLMPADEIHRKPFATQTIYNTSVFIQLFVCLVKELGDTNRNYLWTWFSKIHLKLLLWWHYTFSGHISLALVIY